MRFDRAHADVHLLGDLGVGVAERDQPQHLGLALAEHRGAAARGAHPPIEGSRYLPPLLTMRIARTRSARDASLST